MKHYLLSSDSTRGWWRSRAVGAAAGTAVIAMIVAMSPVAPASEREKGRIDGGQAQPPAPVVTVLNHTALGGLGSGSTIGPDGALYVTNGNDGTLIRVNPRTGSERVIGSGLPPQIIGVGG